MYRIITVCTGNICRSPMAQFCLARAMDEAGLGKDVSIDSAGVTAWEAGRPMDPRAAKELRHHDFAASETREFRAREFQPEWFADRDLVLAMDYGHYTELRNLAASPKERDKVRLIRSFDPSSAQLPVEEQGIEDPWYGTMSDFDSSYALIQASVPGVVQYVRDALTSSGGSR